MRVLQILCSSPGVIEMGVGMFLAAALFHFISALVMSLIMPLLTWLAPGLQPADMGMAAQHPMVMPISWGNFLQALIVLVLCVIVAVAVLRWAAPGNQVRSDTPDN